MASPGLATGVAYDPAKGELFVANGDQTVSVISATTDKVVASVTVGNSPRGITYDPANGDLYVADYGTGAQTVSVISRTNSNAVVATVEAGASPFYSTYNPVNGEIFVTVTGSNYISVISGSSQHGGRGV